MLPHAVFVTDVLTKTFTVYLNVKFYYFCTENFCKLYFSGFVFLREISVGRVKQKTCKRFCEVLDKHFQGTSLSTGEGFAVLGLS